MKTLLDIATLLGIPAFGVTMVEVFCGMPISRFMDRRRQARSAAAADQQRRNDEAFTARVHKAAQDPAYCTLVVENLKQKRTETLFTAVVAWTLVTTALSIAGASGLLGILFNMPITAIILFAAFSLARTTQQIQGFLAAVAKERAPGLPLDGPVPATDASESSS